MDSTSARPSSLPERSSSVSKGHQPAKLCLGCRSLFEHWDNNKDLENISKAKRKRGDFPYDRDLRTWAEAAPQDCTLCRLLLGQIADDELQTIKDYFTFQLYENSLTIYKVYIRILAGGFHLEVRVHKVHGCGLLTPDSRRYDDKRLTWLHGIN
jgi:hypothetical protein